MIVKMEEIFPKVRGEHKKCLSCHRLDQFLMDGSHGDFQSFPIPTLGFLHCEPFPGLHAPAHVFNHHFHFAIPLPPCVEVDSGWF